MNKQAPLLALSLLLLCACGGRKEPGGQVVARVNGSEVTVTELNQEARARGIGGADDPQVRQQLLQSIIDRKLIAEAAIEKEFDRSPEFLTMKKRSDELLLADLFIRKYLASEQEGIDQKALENFVKSRPGNFDERTIFTVDQLTFPQVRSKALMRQILAAGSLAEIEQKLAAAGVPRERVTATWDSAQMPPDLVAKLKALPPGEAFVQPTDPMIAGVIVAAKAAPLPAHTRLAIAALGLQEQRLREVGEFWLKGSRATAKIEYQKGYEPKPAATPGAGSKPK